MSDQLAMVVESPVRLVVYDRAGEVCDVITCHGDAELTRGFKWAIVSAGEAARGAPVGEARRLFAALTGTGPS